MGNNKLIWSTSQTSEQTLQGLLPRRPFLGTASYTRPYPAISPLGFQDSWPPPAIVSRDALHCAAVETGTK